MTASLKCCWRATSISVDSRRSFTGVSFQETMNPSMPAALACVMWRVMTVGSSLEYRPERG